MWLEETVMEVLGSRRPSVIAGLTPPKAAGTFYSLFTKAE